MLMFSIIHFYFDLELLCVVSESSVYINFDGLSDSLMVFANRENLKPEMQGLAFLFKRDNYILVFIISYF